MASGAPFKPGDQIIIKVTNMQVTGHKSYGYIAINALVFQQFCRSASSRSFQLRISTGRSAAGSHVRTPVLQHSIPSALRRAQGCSDLRTAAATPCPAVALAKEEALCGVGLRLLLTFRVLTGSLRRC